MARFVDGKGPPPHELEIGLQCERYHCLPETGGLLDQPAGLVKRMTACVNVMDAWRAWRSRKPGKEGEFMRQFKEYYRLAMEIEKWQL